MSTDELPERLLTAGDDPMERRLVAAVAQERPSPNCGSGWHTPSVFRGPWPWELGAVLRRRQRLWTMHPPRA